MKAQEFLHEEVEINLTKEVKSMQSRLNFLEVACFGRKGVETKFDQLEDKISYLEKQRNED